MLLMILYAWAHLLLPVVAPMTPRSTRMWVCGVMAVQHSTQNIERRHCGLYRRRPRFVFSLALYQGSSRSKWRIDQAVRYHSSWMEPTRSMACLIYINNLQLCLVAVNQVARRRREAVFA